MTLLLELKYLVYKVSTAWDAGSSPCYIDRSYKKKSVPYFFSMLGSRRQGMAEDKGKDIYKGFIFILIYNLSCYIYLRVKFSLKNVRMFNQHLYFCYCSELRI